MECVYMCTYTHFSANGSGGPGISIFRGKCCTSFGKTDIFSLTPKKDITEN